MEPLQTVTTYYNASLIRALYSSVQHVLSLLSLLSSPVAAWCELPPEDVPPVPQLPASHSNSSQRPNCNSLVTAHQLTPLHRTQVNWTTLTNCPAYNGPQRKHRFSVAVSNVECAAIGADRVENTAFQPVYWRAGLYLATASSSLFRSSCLVTGL
jgi:hypothetical protein